MADRKNETERALVWRAARTIHPGIQPRQLYRRLRFLTRVASHWPIVHMALAGGSHLQRASLDARPEALGLLEWPYIHSEWPVQKRLSAYMARICSEHP